MARRSLKPQLNQIRAWVQQGRTDAWIAHQLEVTASELREFRKQHDLTADAEEAGSQEVDLRDEIEAEIEAATAEETEEDAEEEEAPEAEDDVGEGSDDEEPQQDEGRRQSAGRSGGKDRPRAGESSDGSGGERGEGGGRPRRRRRRGKRGGRGRRRELEATFDHGERDGYGLWLDPTVKDNPVYAEHWAGKREVTVRVEAEQIVIRRAGNGDSGD